MKRELDPFESKLKEKLQGKAYFPEDLLWKRLNDELVRSDQAVFSKKRYWILGSAVLVLLSLGTGYFIGLNQRPEIPVASRQLAQLTTGTKGSISPKITSKLDQHKANASKEGKVNPKLTEQNTALHKSIQNVHGKFITTEDIASANRNVRQLLSSDVVQTSNQPSAQLALQTVQSVPSSASTLLSIPMKTTNVMQSDAVLLDRMNLQKVGLIAHSQKEFIQHMHRRQLPVLFSASLALEPNATNRVLSNRVYGAASPFASTEKGKTAANIRLGFQAQLGRHLELGTGIGSSHYITEEQVQNKLVNVDQFQHQMNFESSISSFEIHEDHLQDDPEDQEEHELNFQDSTAFHLNYSLSHSIKSTQIPLTAGIVLQGNKFKFSLRTGLIYNHILQATSLVNIQGFNAIQNNIRPQLVSNTYYQMFQIGAEFPVSSHCSLMLAPKYTYALKSISKTSMLRPNSLGLECALKFYF